MRRHPARLLVLAVLLCASLVSCGGPRALPDVPAAYHRVSELEALVDRGVRAAADPTRREAATTMSCDASEELCALADQIRENDAHIRCDRARRSCAALRERVSTSEAAPGDRS